MGDIKGSAILCVEVVFLLLGGVNETTSPDVVEKTEIALHRTDVKKFKKMKLDLHVLSERGRQDMVFKIVHTITEVVGVPLHAVLENEQVLEMYSRYRSNIELEDKEEEEASFFSEEEDYSEWEEGRIGDFEREEEQTAAESVMVLDVVPKKHILEEEEDEDTDPLGIITQEKTTGGNRWSSAFGFGRRRRRQHAKINLMLGDTVIQQGSASIVAQDFNPVLFLTKTHLNTSIRDLENGLETLKRKQTGRIHQMRVLVKEYFDQFVDCKDKIDLIHHVIQSNMGSTLTDRVLSSLGEIEEDAEKTYAPLLKKKHDADRIRSTLESLKKFEFVFSLPGSLKRNILYNRHELVVRDYKKYKSFRLSGAVGDSDQHLLRCVLAEIDSIISGFRTSLLKQLDDANVNVERHQRVIGYLLELDCPEDPAWFFLHKQDELICGMLDTAQQEHEIRVETVSRRSRMAQEAAKIAAARQAGGRRGNVVKDIDMSSRSVKEARASRELLRRSMERENGTLKSNSDQSLSSKDRRRDDDDESEEVKRRDSHDGGGGDDDGEGEEEEDDAGDEGQGRRRGSGRKRASRLRNRRTSVEPLHIHTGGSNNDDVFKGVDTVAVEQSRVKLIHDLSSIILTKMPDFYVLAKDISGGKFVRSSSSHGRTSKDSHGNVVGIGGVVKIDGENGGDDLDQTKERIGDVIRRIHDKYASLVRASLFPKWMREHYGSYKHKGNVPRNAVGGGVGGVGGGRGSKRSKGSSSSTTLQESVKTVVSCYITMKKLNMPYEHTSMLKHTAEDAFRFFLKQTFVDATYEVSSLYKEEDWVGVEGEIITKLPAKFEAVMLRTLDAVQSIPSLGSSRWFVEGVTVPFLECLRTFADCLHFVAFEALKPNKDGGSQPQLNGKKSENDVADPSHYTSSLHIGDARVVGRKLLAVLANCMYAHNTLFRRLWDTFKQLVPEGVRDALDNHYTRVSDVLVVLETLLERQYVRLILCHVKPILARGILRSGTDWALSHETKSIRSYVFEVLLELVLVDEEVCISLSLSLSLFLAFSPSLFIFFNFSFSLTSFSLTLSSCSFSSVFSPLR